MPEESKQLQMILIVLTYFAYFIILPRATLWERAERVTSGDMIIKNIGVLYKNKQEERGRFISRKNIPHLLENTSEQESDSNRTWIFSSIYLAYYMCMSICIWLRILTVQKNLNQNL